MPVLEVGRWPSPALGLRLELSSLAFPGLDFSVSINTCVSQWLSHVRLRDPMNCSPPGSPVHRILQARIPEWVATPPPGHLPNPGIESASPASPALAGGFFTTEPPGKPQRKGQLFSNISRILSSRGFRLVPT